MSNFKADGTKPQTIEIMVVSRFIKWRHNGRDSVSNHQPCECLLGRLIGADQRKHQSPASLAFVWGIHRRPVNSPHKGPVTRKMFPFDDVVMYLGILLANSGQVMANGIIKLWHWFSNLLGTEPLPGPILTYQQLVPWEHISVRCESQYTHLNSRKYIWKCRLHNDYHYSEVIMNAMAYQITGVSIVCSTVCWGADQRKHQSSASPAFLRGIHRSPVDSPHKGPVKRKMFSFDDAFMAFVQESPEYSSLPQPGILPVSR